MSTPAASAAAPIAGSPPGPTPTRHPRVKVPSVLQMEAVECGAASLAMILGHFGRWATLEELRVKCGVSRDGSNASNLLKAARSYGLEAKGFRKEISQLTEMKFPMIVFWNFNHFLILEGIDEKGRVYLNDPAAGRRTITLDEFDLAYTGVALTFAPGPNFKPGGTKPSVLGAVMRRFEGLGPALNLLLLIGVTLIVPGLVIPIFGSTFIDKVLVENSSSWVKPLLVGIGITFCLQTALIWLEQHYLLKVRTRISVDTTQRFFWHTLNLPVTFFSQRSAGDISSRVHINDTVARLISEDLVGSILACIQAVFFCLLMFFYDVLLTSIVIAEVIANIYLMKWLSARLTAASQKLAIDGGKVYGATMGGLEIMETLKASGNENNFFSKWSGYQTRFVNAEQDIVKVGLFAGSLPAVLAVSGQALILGVGGLRIMDGALTIGMLVAFQALAQNFSGPVHKLVELFKKLMQSAGNINRVDDVLNNPRDPYAGDMALLAKPNPDIPKLSGQVSLESVTFGYNPAGTPLLMDFSLRLKPGDRVAIVGPSGCGKSTVSKLIVGLFSPWSGRVLFDGKERSQIDRITFANSVSYVDQDINLFEGSFRDNISMWDDSIELDHIIQAAKDACIHDFIISRPEGYESRIRDGGMDLSGGQRQRIEIARALATNPSILVLDEATSALDSATEEQVDRHLRQRGCTCLIVAHRLSTVRDADLILVLRDGLIVEHGVHEELMQKTQGVYAKLFSGH